jgi:hypothetical protein
MATSPELLPSHQSLISDSAITAEIAAARGYRSIEKKTDLKGLGFSGAQCRVPALLIPIHSVHGELAGYQIRPDDPRAVNGRILKYETPKGMRMLLDVPPAARAALGDPHIPFTITEGARKADAAVSLDACCVSLLGVWNWRGTNVYGGKTALPDLEAVACNGRTVYLAFDSDAMTKAAVHGALTRLSALLKSRGAHVRIVYLPADPTGTKTGLDDFLAAGHAMSDVYALATDELRPLPGAARDGEILAEAGPYRERREGLFLLKTKEGDEAEIRLTNFRARIVGEVARDDGAETRLSIEVEGTVGETPRRFAVTAAQFSGMAWPIEHLGSGAIVTAGFGQKDHARCAIQELSGSVPRRSIYEHTGWRILDGVPAFLHAGGAIGPNGPVPGTETDIQDLLHMVRFPDPLPSGEELQDAIAASLRILDLLPGPITIPLLGLVYRAPLGSTDLAMHLAGATGSGKSELAALAMQHYGAGFTRKNLPSWASTANALGTLQFMAKDIVVVMDDFAPNGTQQDAAALNRKVDQVIRGAGNSSGRSRAAPDGTLRPTRAPRSSLLSTGEDAFRGQSIQGRTVTLEVTAKLGKPGGIQSEALSACQQDGAEGRYAAVMASYLQWLARRHAGLANEVRTRFEQFRERARGTGGHARDPEKVAHLAVGWDLFLDFVVEAGVLPEAEASAFRQRVWHALLTTAAAQASFQQVSDPVVRFIELLDAALSSGLAHCVSPDGGFPDSTPERWGWARRSQGEGAGGDWITRGSQVGWIEGCDLYLDIDSALRAVQIAAGSGEGILLGAGALAKRLSEAHLLLSEDEARGRCRIRKVLQGKRRAVLHLHADTAERLLPPDERPTRPSDAGAASIGSPEADNGPKVWADVQAHGPEGDNDRAHTATSSDAAEARGSPGAGEWAEWAGHGADGVDNIDDVSSGRSAPVCPSPAAPLTMSMARPSRRGTRAEYEPCECAGDGDGGGLLNFDPPREPESVSRHHDGKVSP